MHQCVLWKDFNFSYLDVYFCFIIVSVMLKDVFFYILLCFCML